MSEKKAPIPEKGVKVVRGRPGLENGTCPKCQAAVPPSKTADGRLEYRCVRCGTRFAHRRI